MPVCTKCKVEKTSDAFSVRLDANSKLRKECKECRNSYERDYNSRNIRKIQEGNKQYYKDHKEEIQEYKKEYGTLNKKRISDRKKEYRSMHQEEISRMKKTYYEMHREEILRKKKEKYSYAVGRARNLKYGHRLTVAEYEQKFVSQGGNCAICNQPGTTTAKALSVDHNHATGETRGLLCNSCNLGLGKFKDSPDFLLAAAAYLKAHSNVPSDNNNSR